MYYNEFNVAWEDQKAKILFFVLLVAIGFGGGLLVLAVIIIILSALGILAI